MLELTNIITVSVSQTPTGLGEFNVNNLALFSDETPLAGLVAYGSYRTYVSAKAVANDWGTASETYLQASAVFSQQPNILAGGGVLNIFPINVGETLGQAVTRCLDMVYFCGIISTVYPALGAMKALADQVQAYGDKILFLPSSDSNAIAGDFTDIKNATDNYARCLYYSTSAQKARFFAAAAAGRGFSVNFEGSNTANTMNLKQLVGIDPDTGITQTIYNNCQTAGVDIYGSFAGISAYISNGNNKYFDEIYNLIWFVNKIKVDGFNALLQVGNKIPQTEPGMSFLKSVFRAVCDAAVNNGYLAPGSWTSAEWFGSQDDMIKNITQKGYYIYSQPVSKQSATNRAARQAPPIQIAVKEAGAIHSTNIIVSINP